MKAGPWILLLVLVVFLAACCCTVTGGGGNVTAPSPAVDSSGIPVGKGSFVFTDMRGNADRPLRVYTYRPAAWNVSGPILIVIPGADRSAMPPRDVWAPYGDLYSCLIVVPEFSLKYYPDDS